MKRATITVLGLFALQFLASCDKSDAVAPEVAIVDGAWAFVEVLPGTESRIYRRLGDLSGEVDGFEFAPNGILLVRNAGFCGTPPLTFSTYNGTWVAESNESYILSYNYLGALSDIRLTVFSVTEQELECHFEVLE